MFIWVGLQASPDILQQLFHANTIGQVDIEMVRDSKKLRCNYHCSEEQSHCADTFLSILDPNART